MPATVNIRRAFVDVSGRRVHYRWCGRGPVVLMLHQSPKSSREYQDLMADWGARFTCIAPDTPGYGFSDPLPGRPQDLAAFADAACAFMDALGLERPLVYGFHTGAAIAAELAARHPGRVRALAANGYVVLTARERADFLDHYLPPFTPSWDGAHLAWLWARLREQVIFFPWHRRALTARMDYDMSSPAALHENVMEFLHAGDHYRDAYGAAFRWKGDETLRRITSPTLIVAQENDPLYAHLERLPSAPDNIEVAGLPSHKAAIERVISFLGANAKGADPGRDFEGEGFRTVNGLQIRLRLTGDQRGAPVLVLHDIGESGALVDDGKGQPRIIPDLPGHGLSDPLSGEITLTAIAETLVDLLTDLDIGSVRLEAKGLSCLIATEMNRMAPSLFNGIDMDPGVLPDGAGWADFCRRRFPPLTPDAHGGYLLEAWLMVRNGELFSPWYDQRAAAIIRREADLNPDRLHRRLVALLDSLPTSHRLMESLVDYPVEERLRQAGLA